jgi:transposase
MARRHYTPEFRAEAVRLVQESGKSPEQIAGDLGVAGETLRIWIRQHETDTGQLNGLTTTERDELMRLRKENQILREEREILRKAAAFFAQEINKTS